MNSEENMMENLDRFEYHLTHPKRYKNYRFPVANCIHLHEQRICTHKIKLLQVELSVFRLTLF